MTARERWQHAAAAWSLLYRSMEAGSGDANWALQLAAERLRHAGDGGLAVDVEELADGWFPADSEIRAMMDRVAELGARLEKETLR